MPDIYFLIGNPMLFSIQIICRKIADMCQKLIYPKLQNYWNSSLLYIQTHNIIIPQNTQTHK